MGYFRNHWWRFRRQVIAWLRDRYSDGSTIITVWLHQWRAVVPKKTPWGWFREAMAYAHSRRTDGVADRCNRLSGLGAAVSFKHLLTQTAISIDQTANVVLSWLSPWAWRGAWADETLSCRCYRAWRDGAVMGKVFMPLIDFLFAWQTLPEGAIGHCHGAYIKERAKYNHPPEMR